MKITEKMFFSYDPEDGITFHSNEKDAKDTAEETMAFYRDVARDDYWHENTEDICWGEVKYRQCAVCVKREPAPVDSGFDELLDYELSEVEK